MASFSLLGLQLPEGIPLVVPQQSLDMPSKVVSGGWCARGYVLAGFAPQP